MLPMDGFHLYKRELDAMPVRFWTFEVIFLLVLNILFL
jgi:pantothenate kinase